MTHVGTTIWASEALPPMTLQVVLIGNDGIVIASDTRATNSPQEISKEFKAIQTTDELQKIKLVNSRFVYLFAGDECAKMVGAAVARVVGESLDCLSETLVREISNSTLREYRRLGPRDRVDYRKVIWVQAKEAGWGVWIAKCLDRDACFDVEFIFVNRRKLAFFAGHEPNPARYIVEDYYLEHKYPLRSVSSLKRMAAHVIVTGSKFSSNVRGLEMVFGVNNSFTQVSQDDLQTLINESDRLHAGINKYFDDPKSIPQI